MISIVSPAKTLDLSKGKYQDIATLPQFQTETMQLARLLKKLKKEELKDLMHISDKLTDENHLRYKQFSKEYTDENASPALYAFRGDVYTGLDADTMNKHDVKYAQKHFRILSGLYGVLRPMDLMQAYRLEMGTKLENKKGKNLYEFWGDKISKQLNKDLEEAGTSTLLNLASNEYFKAVDKKKLKADIIDVDFREMRNGKLTFVSFNAKKARGLMARYVIDHRIKKSDDLLGFDADGYTYSEEGSTNGKLLFVK